MFSVWAEVFHLIALFVLESRQKNAGNILFNISEAGKEDGFELIYVQIVRLEIKQK